jgi:CBS domain-containing protein
MNRSDTHLDAMLRHLGAAYYESMHGRAAPDDVSRALDQVAEHMGERPGGPASAVRGRAHGRRQHGPHPLEHHGRWHSRIRDIMTTDVVTVDRITPYKEIVQKLTEHQISGMPVLIMGRHVAGVVSEGDLIAAEAESADGGRSGLAKVLHRGRADDAHRPLTAADLMTAPAVTIHPDATISAAARLMTTHQVRRLPVVDPDGALIGLVSRRDLLRLFLRKDEDIARQVGELLAEILPADQPDIKVTVHNGVVTLDGTAALDGQQDLLPVALRLIRDIDGVIDVRSHVNVAG